MLFDLDFILHTADLYVGHKMDCFEYICKQPSDISVDDDKGNKLCEI